MSVVYFVIVRIEDLSRIVWWGIKELFGLFIYDFLNFYNIVYFGMRKSLMVVYYLGFYEY